MIAKKKSNWICTCGAKNEYDDESCYLCEKKNVEKEKSDSAPKFSNIKKKTSYDEIHLWPIFSQFIKLRDTDHNGSGKCFTCGKVVSWTEGQCGHGIPRQHKATKYNEVNNALQCVTCNSFQDGCSEAYAIEMDKKHGTGTWDNMRLEAKKIVSISNFEYDLMIAHYSKEVERLKREKGLLK